MKTAVETRFSGPAPLRLEPDEKIPVIIVGNYPDLGRLAAARFLEWAAANPEGIVALPTGKTPQYFIHYVTNWLDAWNDKTSHKSLEMAGLDPARKPRLDGLRFVQIDEFYPINSSHHNSFFYYVSRYYLTDFGINSDRTKLINCNSIGLKKGQCLEDIWEDGEVDLSLRFRKPRSRREQARKDLIARVDQWCVEYEDGIRSLGGIGFFLGGIGPDGHIGFNVRGSDLYSTTRLAEINYETRAAAAVDLGGMEIAGKKKVITIGLGTINYNPECTAIILAAGEAKAAIVEKAITSKRNVDVPASVLQSLKNARFYLTSGAAVMLEGRKILQITAGERPEPPDQQQTVINLSLKTGKPIAELTKADYQNDPFGALLLKHSPGDYHQHNTATIKALKNKIERGVKAEAGQIFLHTEPHHDDIMLGYLPWAVRHIRDHSTAHHFATLTSGFTAVTNDYMLSKLQKMRTALQKGIFEDYLEDGYFDPANELGRNRDVWQYLDGVAAMSASMQEEGMLRRLLRNLIEIFDEDDRANILDRVQELINYFETQYPGKKDLPHIQKLKGMSREWESACLWGYFGWNSSAIRHLRLGFYQGDIFTEDPTIGRDVQPVCNLLADIQPDIVTVAFDPEGSGPDTHYKVLQAVSEALKLHNSHAAKKVSRVIGYRNIWYRFHPGEADICVPVSLNMLTLQHGSFMSTYISQKQASFPSHEYDGPFSKLAQKIQVEQYQMLKTCLGREFFYEHPSALIRGTRGFVFLKEMEPDAFYSFAKGLKKRAEKNGGV